MVDQLTGVARMDGPFQAEIETMPLDALRQLRERLLARAVRRARGAPFFCGRLAALADEPDTLTPERFQACVPLTTKQDLREARDAAWVTAAQGRIALILGTSGTTGTRVALPYTAQDLACWHSLVARTLWTNGLRPDDVALLPVPVGLFTGGHAMLGGLTHLGCTVLPLGPVPPPVMADTLRGAFGVVPTAAVALPSYMLRLLDALPGLGYDPATSPLRIGSFGAEAWSEAARQRLEVGFGLRAVDSYGIGEICGPGIAAECEVGHGMHVWEDAFFAEIVHPQTGEPLPAGEVGELVLTPLFREAFPLLRYRTGDEAALIPEPCPCGRTHQRISRVARRLDDVLVITGVNIDPGDMERVLYAIPWAGSEFALEVGGANRDALLIHLEVRADAPPPAEAEAQIVRAVRQYFPVRISLQFYPAGQLERAPGKAKRLRG